MKKFIKILFLSLMLTVFTMSAVYLIDYLAWLEICLESLLIIGVVAFVIVFVNVAC